MIAIDTNVLIYACDQTDPRRQNIALDLIANAQDGVLLSQVACEFLAAPASSTNRDSRRLTPGIASASSGIFCRSSCPRTAT